MALVGWLFKCYRKYIYIRGAQIASVSKFCMVASNIFSVIIAVFSVTYKSLWQFTCSKQKVLANRFTGYSKIVGPLDGTLVMSLS